MATTYDFPSDILAGQEELHKVLAELTALLKRVFNCWGFRLNRPSIANYQMCG
ncbi:hypothetical protein ACFWPY_40525 [Streptomyces sp. NPDC058527]|uniref:hypothetical protein n=1 Tax=Streptomyces sp. NPDC058527 TaxID=3346539 RepID=UPI00365E8AE6